MVIFIAKFILPRIHADFQHGIVNDFAVKRTLSGTIFQCEKVHLLAKDSRAFRLWKGGAWMPEKQVKSKQRVADHGEVFTAEREVKAMCDLVKPETERIDSRFLEPACGEGAFLTEILRRQKPSGLRKILRHRYY